jgi:hypothetical protein
VKVWSAIVTVPVRAAPVFAAALTATDPFPVPVAVPTIASQEL